MSFMEKALRTINTKDRQEQQHLCHRLRSIWCLERERERNNNNNDVVNIDVIFEKT